LVRNIGLRKMTTSTISHILDTTNFQHTRLDYRTTSIRLVRVKLLLSSDGLIQCNINQQKLPDPYQDGATGKNEYIAMGSEDTNGEHHSYMCLSYAWGDP